MESIRIARETCPEHGFIYFIEYLPPKSLVSQVTMNECSSFMVQGEDSLTILGENGVATYAIQPIDEEFYYATFTDWHLYDPPVVRHQHEYGIVR